MIHAPRLLLWTAAVIVGGTLPVLAAENGTPRVTHHTQEFKVSRLGDTDLHCAALAKEANAMRDIIITKQGIEDDSEMKTRGIGAAGAVGSLLLGTVTAGVGLAAAGFLAAVPRHNGYPEPGRHQ